MLKIFIILFSFFFCFSHVQANDVDSWKNIENITWDAAKNTDGSFDLQKQIAIAWLPSNQVAGKWVRLSASTMGPIEFKVWILMFEGDRSLVRPMPTLCKLSDGKTTCSVIAWIPHSYGQKVRASFYSDGNAVTIIDPHVESSLILNSKPSDLERFSQLALQMKEVFFKSHEVNWEKLISWVTPALAAPGDLDPLPYMFSLMAKELPSGGHTYVYNTASSASPTEENSVEFPKCTNRRNHEVLLTLPETPSNKRDENDYIRAAHRCFRQPNVNHWIIDLRQNSGGDAALQVAALTPLIGLGTSLQYLNNKGNYIAVRITPKGVFNSHLLQYAFHRKPIFIPQSAKVTVLLGSGCASACEALAIALTAKQNIQSMGQATAGFATGNEILKINDNFNLALTSGYMTDRDGKVIYPRITPDILASDEIINKIFKID